MASMCEPGFKDLLGLGLGLWQEGNNKNEWPPLGFHRRTVTATVLTAAAGVLASVGGIGGGALFVCILNLVMEFDSKTSAVVSAFEVLAISLVGICVYMPQTQTQTQTQNKKKPLIDYNVALILQPNLLLGISIGVIFNIVFPEWLMLLLLSVVLCYMTVSSCKSTYKTWQCENQQIRGVMMDEENEIQGDSEQPKGESAGHSNSSTSSSALLEPLLQAAVQVKPPAPVLPPADARFRNYPAKKFGLLCLIWVGFYAINLLLKDQLSPLKLHHFLKKQMTAALSRSFLEITRLSAWSAAAADSITGLTRAGLQSFFRIKRCGIAYWGVSGLQIPLAVGTTVWMLKLKRKSAKKHGEYQSIPAITKKLEKGVFPIMALFAGILGGMLGIGGGIIINPFMVQAGIPVQVTAATCVFMMFFSASMSVAEYLLVGAVPMEYALYFSFICLLSSLLGLYITEQAIKKYKRVSLITISVTCVISLTTVLMLLFGGIKVWEQYQAGEYMGFRLPC